MIYDPDEQEKHRKVLESIESSIATKRNEQARAEAAREQASEALRANLSALKDNYDLADPKDIPGALAALKAEFDRLTAEAQKKLDESHEQ